MSVSNILNVIGVGVLAIEAFGVRDNAESLIDTFRTRLFQLLRSYWFVFLVPIIFALTESVTIFRLVSEGEFSAADFYYIAILVFAAGVVLYAILMAVLFIAGGILHLLDRFPQGSVAGIGAVTAIAGLILDFLPG